MDVDQPKILRRDDQIVVGIFLAIFLALTCIYFWQRAITNGGVIDFEDMPVRHAQYLVDVNQANWPEFANLPGIGEKLARQIVSHRDQHGPFSSKDQLQEVTGIGQAKLESMRPYLMIRIPELNGRLEPTNE